MKNNEKINKEISSTAIMGEPETVFDMINKYGTYEIQPTADTDNEFGRFPPNQGSKNDNLYAW